jgi:hypothetical protein
LAQAAIQFNAASAHLNDLSFGGAYTGTDKQTIYKITISTAASTDQFTWMKSMDGGSTWSSASSAISITGSAQVIDNGVSVSFGAITGHTAGDYWTQTINRPVVRWQRTGGFVNRQFVNAGQLADLENGLKFSVAAPVANDEWDFSVMPAILGKTHVHKNRLWAADGNNNTFAWCSALMDPTDLISYENAGYIDFSYMLPMGERLMDISTHIDYIVYWFTDNILIYGGTTPVGVSADFGLAQHIKQIGVVGPNAIIHNEADSAFISPHGIKSLRQVVTTGNMEIKDVSENINPDLVAALGRNMDGIYSVVHSPRLACYLFLVGDTIYVLSYRYGAWSRIQVTSGPYYPSHFAITTQQVYCIFSTISDDIYFGLSELLGFFGVGSCWGFFSVVYIGTFKSEISWTLQTGYIPIMENRFNLKSALEELQVWFLSWISESVTVKTQTIQDGLVPENQAAFNHQTFSIPAAPSGYNDKMANFVKLMLLDTCNYVSFTFTGSSALGPVIFQNLAVLGKVIKGDMI